MNCTTTKLVMYGDLNSGRKLFGGRALAWIDEAAAIYVLGLLGNTPHNIVTAHMSSINFIASGELGDIIEIGSEVVRIGNSSITVSCTMRNKNSGKDIVKVDEIVFVNLDENGKPKPHGLK